MFFYVIYQVNDIKKEDPRLPKEKSECNVDFDRFPYVALRETMGSR